VFHFIARSEIHDACSEPATESAVAVVGHFVDSGREEQMFIAPNRPLRKSVGIGTRLYLGINGRHILFLKNVQKQFATLKTWQFQ